MLSKLAFINTNCSSVGAHAAPPSSEHGASWALFLRTLSNGFLLAHYWIAGRALRALFALVTLLAVMSFGACGTISALNKTKPARVPTGHQINIGISLYNICLISIMHFSLWSSHENINFEYWKGMARLIAPRKLSPMCDAPLKIQHFAKNV